MEKGRGSNFSRLLNHVKEGHPTVTHSQRQYEAASSLLSVLWNVGDILAEALPRGCLPAHSPWTRRLSRIFNFLRVRESLENLPDAKTSKGNLAAIPMETILFLRPCLMYSIPISNLPHNSLLLLLASFTYSKTPRISSSTLVESARSRFMERLELSAHSPMVLLARDATSTGASRSQSAGMMRLGLDGLTPYGEGRWGIVTGHPGPMT